MFCDLDYRFLMSLERLPIEVILLTTSLIIMPFLNVLKKLLRMFSRHGWLCLQLLVLDNRHDGINLRFSRIDFSANSFPALSFIVISVTMDSIFFSVLAFF